jgi:hypothetical protein
MSRRIRHGRSKPMTREDRRNRDERNERRGRDSKAIARRKNKVVPGEKR